MKGVWCTPDGVQPTGVAYDQVDDLMQGAVP